MHAQLSCGVCESTSLNLCAWSHVIPGTCRFQKRPLKLPCKLYVMLWSLCRHEAQGNNQGANRGAAHRP